MTHGAPDITAILLRWNAGEQDALSQLSDAVYGELRGLARSFLAKERPGHTLSATALVHEAYLRLVDQRKVGWEHRAHFFGAAANIMRRVLVDHAKAKLTAKRGGDVNKVSLDEIPGGLPAQDGFLEDIVDLDAAMKELAALDPRKVRIVEMKFFAGMTNQETAHALDISDATVERDWNLARAWLIRRLSPPV